GMAITPTLAERLQRVLDAHSLPCGTAVAASGELLARAGDFESFGSAGLVSALLGPYGSADATFASLQGAVLPQIWGQGAEFAFLFKPSPGLMVVVFGRSRQDVLAQVEMAKAVGHSIDQEFTSTSA